jgi:membrane associated rhomboid family serine protease
LPLSYHWQQRIERWKNATRGFFGGGENNQPRPKLCPACGTLVGITATRCHECGANLRFSLAALSKGLSGFFGGQAPATTAILITNIVMFAITLLVGFARGQGQGFSILFSVSDEALIRLGMGIPFGGVNLSGGPGNPLIHLDFNWYRLVTATYLHGGLIHIGFNMMVLLDVGPVVEEVYGSARYFFLYTVCGLSGSLLSASFSGGSSVGASGAILGLVGVLIAITYRRSGAQIQQLRGRLISWVVTIFAIGLFFRGLRTDNWGHFGGLAAGFLLGRFFADREPMNSRERNTAYTLGWSALAVVVACFVLMILHFSKPILG